MVDEDRQVVWVSGQKRIMRVGTDLSNEQIVGMDGVKTVSVDLDANGGIWAAEWGPDQIVHFDVDGNLISGDMLPNLAMQVSR